MLLWETYRQLGPVELRKEALRLRLLLLLLLVDYNN